MTFLRAMPDADLVVTTALAALVGPGVRVTADLPADLEQIPKLVRVERVGGRRHRFGDEPLMYVSCFTPTSRRATADLALEVDDLVMRLSGTVAAGGQVQDVECRIGPRFITYENPRVWRFQAAYSLAVYPVG